MKITCQSCGAKYTIADDKVRGRTVKIRCKKCSAAIVISAAEEQPENEDGETRIYETAPGAPLPGQPQGSPAPAEEAGAEWSLNVAEGDQRTVSAEEVVQLYRSGVVNDETYAWKDGMADWAPLSEVQELMDKIRGAAPKTSAAPPRPAAGGTPLPASPEAAMSAAAPKAAARRAEGRAKGQDLFGGGGEAAAAAGASPAAGRNSPSQVPLAKPTGLFTAERNENSVLFSLDALKAPKPAAAQPSTGRTAPPPAGGMGVPPPSGIVDIRKLASIAPPPMDDGRGFDDIANLGGGAMMTALAAPDLTAAPPPEPPPQAAAPAMDVYGQPVKQGGGSKMVIVLLAATLAIVVIGFGGFLLFGRSKPAETPAASATATASAAPTATDTAKPADTAAATASAPAGGTAPTDTAASGAADKDKKPAGAADTAKQPVGGPLPTAAKTSDPKTPDPKATEPAKTADPPPATGGADKPFDRGAAVAALGAAAGAASGCKKPDGPTGTGRVSVTFAPTGRVTSANVQGPPFAGTSVGGCVAARFRSASVPPFSGGPVTVNKSFTIN